MRRVDLLEMLVEQGRELERVRAELANAREQLADRRIVIEGCGSIAEAALELGEVFEAAQRAADLYVENVRRVANASGEEASRAASNPVDPAVLVQSAKASQGVYARNRAVAGRNNPRHAARSVR